MQNNETNKCSFCHKENEDTVVLTGPRYTIKKCQSCGLIYQEISSDFQYINYDNIYTDHPPSTKITYSQRKYFEGILRDIQPSQSGPGHLLEIGCSYGDLLDYFKEHGWTTRGIDRSSNAVQFARGRGLSCRNLPLEDYSPDSKFDVIVMIHVIEHLPNPVESLPKIRSWLAPEGILYLRLPNVGSTFVTKNRSNFLGQLKPFEHLFYYSIDTIKKLLKNAGYSSTVTLEGRYYLSDLINSKIRSKLVLNDNWIKLNYEKPGKSKLLYNILKKFYESVLLRGLSVIPVSRKDREIVVVARKRTLE